MWQEKINLLSSKKYNPKKHGKEKINPKNVSMKKSICIMKNVISSKSQFTS